MKTPPFHLGGYDLDPTRIVAVSPLYMIHSHSHADTTTSGRWTLNLHLDTGALLTIPLDGYDTKLMAECKRASLLEEIRRVS